jgi:hypothetical protein
MHGTTIVVISITCVYCVGASHTIHIIRKISLLDMQLR